ncbi:MAG: KamA family radical SAM protein [Akkermansiaceae bacterium]
MSDISFTPSAPGYWAEQNIPADDWNSAKWQLKNRVSKLEDIEKHLTLSEEERAGILLTGTKLATAVTPHYFNLIHPTDPDCPIRRQVIPRIEETYTDPSEMSDPCGEDSHMPVPGLVHRYPDRVLFLVTDRCASYCRYCTRSRVVSGVSDQKLETQWDMAIEYLKRTPQVRDVLLSGGDPLLFSDAKLEKLLSRLHAIPHIQFLRIGSRIPIFLPQRITSELCAMLRKFHPLFISIHTNHPKELTSEVRDGLGRLADAGIVMGNQAVLLDKVNDSVEVQKELVQKLLMCRVRPYYLYQGDLIQGTSHLRTKISKGIKIIEGLRGHTSGYAIPQYVVDGPSGGGKIPLNPQYIVENNEKHTVLRNYEGKEFIYPEAQTASVIPEV